MKYFILLLFIPFGSMAQHTAFNTGYHFISSGNTLQDRCFYFLTLLQKNAGIREQLSRNAELNSILNARASSIQNIQNAKSDSSVSYILNNFLWRDDEINIVADQLAQSIKGEQKKLLVSQLIQCGYFEKYESLSSDSLIRHAWQDAAASINYIIRAYTSNKKLRYPAIDSAHYPVNSKYYSGLLYEMLLTIKNRTGVSDLFFGLSLEIATTLLKINDRDEAVRYEPLRATNHTAYQYIPAVNWNKYKYSVILVLGEGPEDETVPLSPHGKFRCQAAADLYHRGLAPFIIVSGGHVHPFQTVYSEAIEMRKYLIKELGIPETAVIAEPYARHTTTNFRNACRIVFRNNIPERLKCLAVTGKAHADYVANKRFDDRCMLELGYLPFRALTRLNDFAFEFYPVKMCLYVDALDPLDP